MRGATLHFLHFLHFVKHLRCGLPLTCLRIRNVFCEPPKNHSDIIFMEQRYLKISTLTGTPFWDQSATSKKGQVVLLVNEKQKWKLKQDDQTMRRKCDPLCGRSLQILEGQLLGSLLNANTPKMECIRISYPDEI